MKVSKRSSVVDGCSIYLTPVVGGELTSSFAADLLRMYLLFCIRHEFTAIMSGGLERCKLVIYGANSFDLLKFETGKHRYQIRSKEDERIHTGFVEIEVKPRTIEWIGPSEGESLPPQPGPLAEKIRTYNYIKGTVIDHRGNEMVNYSLWPFLNGKMEYVLEEISQQ